MQPCIQGVGFGDEECVGEYDEKNIGNRDLLYSTHPALTLAKCVAARRFTLGEAQKGNLSRRRNRYHLRSHRHHRLIALEHFGLVQ